MKNKRLVFSFGALLIAAFVIATLGCPSPTGDKPAAGDKTELTQIISQAENLIKNTAATDNSADVPSGAEYVPLEEKAALESALNRAKNVQGKSGATQSEINSVVNALRTAIEAFENAKLTGTGAGLNKSALTTAINEAETLLSDTAVSQSASAVPDGMNYVTPTEKARLESALNDAKAAKARESATQQDIEYAVTALTLAISDFIDAKNGHTGSKTNWSYTVSFDLNYSGAGNPPASISIENPNFTLDDAGSFLPAPNRQSYELIGWYRNQAEPWGEPFTATTSVTADVTLYARWEVRYTITYNLDGGEIAGQTPDAYGNVEAYYTGAQEITLPEPTKTDYRLRAGTRIRASAELR